MNDSLARKERSVLGSLLDQFPTPVPPTVQGILRNAPESFDDRRHGTVASAIYELWQAGKPVHAMAVTEYLEVKQRCVLAGGPTYTTELCQSALPIVIAELEAEDIWKAYQQRRAKVVFCEAARAVEESPDKTPLIIQGAISTLGSLAEQTRNRSRLTLRRPSEILSMQFDESDLILGDRLLALWQQLVIAAAGGLGKSRLLLQLAACVVTGRRFLCFETKGKHLRWLILQTENSNRRLQEDLARLRAWLGEDWGLFEERVLIHTIEIDSDSFVSLDNPENLANIEAAVEEAKPDIIAPDPLCDFAIGDLNKDGDMKATLNALSRICRKGNPQRAIAVLHHALTGRSGAARATGYDRTSFARNSKALHAWARGQINLVPVDGDSNDRLIVACGKCSNGREFQSFAICLNPETMIYECDPSVDIKQWEQEISSSTKGSLMTPEKVKALCRRPMSKAELAKTIMEDCGCYRGSAYRYIARAQQAREINLNESLGTYTAK